MSRYVVSVVGGEGWRESSKAKAMNGAYKLARSLGPECKGVRVLNAALEPLAGWVWSVDAKCIVRVVVG